MADKEIVTSIKDISIKLENINNTIRNSKQESTKASMDYDKIIQDLVMNIDNEKSLFKNHNDLHGQVLFSLMFSCSLFLQ